jgi:hypothetical protein
MVDKQALKSMVTPKPSAPVKNMLNVRPSKAPKSDGWHAGLRVANRIPAATVVKLAELAR